ncbi:MAG TPA: prolipoprotein diacylglyceryl transferase [Jiangellaceae bacterium]|nr:prolipoprotein diacylglyceryl transferase [Jiangellaceae bacterium]
MISGAVVASIPSPTEGVWYLGPVPIRAYALAILLGIVVAIWLGERRWVARGGEPGQVTDVAIWAVPFGIVGARLYHVLTDWDRYFGPDQDPTDALRIWAGGLSVFGAIAGGALGGYLAARRKGMPFPALADALAPGVVLAQAIGRWGNYFNQELFGRPTELPWGLEIDPDRRPVGYREFETFHPTFLYESLWAVAAAVVLIWADRRFRMGHGRVFALYVALYTAGRTLIETLRIDTGGAVEGPAREILGLRINAWVSILLFVGAVAYIVISARLRPGRETIERPAELTDDREPDGQPAGAESSGEQAGAEPSGQPPEAEPDGGGEAADAEGADGEPATGEATSAGSPQEGNRNSAG